MFEMTPDMMPGPTHEAKVIQLAQSNARTECYRLMNLIDSHPSPYNHEALDLARKAYDGTIDQLKKLLGDNAPCHQVDCDLWSAYSDAYKAEYSFRPRLPISQQEVESWLQSHGFTKK